MKTTHLRSVTLLALFALLGTSVYADSGAYAQIIKDRESVLSQILAEQQDRRQTGLADEAAVVSAQLALYKFRRDTAASQPEKIKQQEEIVSVHETKLATVKAQFQIGVGSHIDVLQATDALLHARQVLEKLRAGEKKD